MSSYIKLIIFILVLLLISAAILFIDSSVDNMNELMPVISENIVNGDKDYNDAVNLVNDKNYAEAMKKATSAGNNYNSSLSKLNILKDKFTPDVNLVHKQYINNTIMNYTGTNYGYEANTYMDQSLEYRDARDSLVTQNPNMFKQNFII